MRSVFFFQAEDGIRDLVRSRGLGDVYKRQPSGIAPLQTVIIRLVDEFGTRFAALQAGDAANVAVSYTHLTLPTSDLV